MAVVSAVPYRVWLQACGRDPGRESVRAWRQEMAPAAEHARDRLLTAITLALPPLDGGADQVVEADRIRQERIGAAVRVRPSQRAPAGVWWYLREPGHGSPVLDPLRIDPWLPSEYPDERTALNTAQAQLGRPECLSARWWIDHRDRWDGFPRWEIILNARALKIVPYARWRDERGLAHDGEVTRRWQAEIAAAGETSKVRILSLAALTLPALQGSPRQVSWAHDLRRDRMGRALHVWSSDRAPGGAWWFVGEPGGVDPLMVGRAATMEGYPSEQACLTALQQVLNVPARRDASWWIDTRDLW